MKHFYYNSVFIIALLVALGNFVAQAAAPISTLKITSQGTGSGTFSFTPKPLSLSCTATECSATFKAKTKVSTIARAAKKSVFKGWSGLCKGTKTCTLKLKGDTKVTATFESAGAASKKKIVPPSAPVLESKPKAAPTPVAMNIQNMAFEKSSVTVSVGTTVTWTNRDGAAHTVTSDGGLFGSDLLATGKSFSFTFTKEGIYRYSCGPHPSMQGTVVVSQ